MDAVSRGHRYADKAQDVAFNPVGQIVGQMKKVRPVKDVIYDLVEETIEATERLERTLGQTAADRAERPRSGPAATRRRRWSGACGW